MGRIMRSGGMQDPPINRFGGLPTMSSIRTSCTFGSAGRPVGGVNLMMLFFEQLTLVFCQDRHDSSVHLCMGNNKLCFYFGQSLRK